MSAAISAKVSIHLNKFKRKKVNFDKAWQCDQEVILPFKKRELELYKVMNLTMLIDKLAKNNSTIIGLFLTSNFNEL